MLQSFFALFVCLFIAFPSHSVADEINLARPDIKEVVDQFYKRRVEFFKASLRNLEQGNDPVEFTYDWSEPLTATAQKIRQTGDPSLRQVLLLSYLQMVGFHAAKFDTAVVRRAFKEIPPTSTLWTIPEAPRLADLTDKPGTKEFEAYIEHFINEHPSKDFVVPNLFYLAEAAFNANKPNRVTKYIDELEFDYSLSRWYEDAKRQFAPDRAIMPGKKIPPFSFKSLENPSMVYSSQSLKGKYVLIEFWEITSKPCIADLPFLDTAYERYGDRNFTVLTVAFNAPSIEKIQAEKWEMPGLNATLAGGPTGNEAKKFAVMELPKVILINPNGVIVAEGREIRGKKLLATLDRIFKEKK